MTKTELITLVSAIKDLPSFSELEERAGLARGTINHIQKERSLRPEHVSKLVPVLLDYKKRLLHVIDIINNTNASKMKVEISEYVLNLNQEGKLEIGLIPFENKENEN